MAIEQNIKRARFVSVRALSLPWTDVDFTITTRCSSPFFSVVTRNIPSIHIPTEQFIVLEGQQLRPKRALRRIPLHRHLQNSSTSTDQAHRLLLLRNDGYTLYIVPRILTGLKASMPEKRRTTWRKH